MIKVTLKGDVIKEYNEGITAYEVAKDISAGLARAACAARIDGQNCDLRTPLLKDCYLEILTFDDEYGRWTFRHTASHILAQAVKRLFPNAKLAIGPAVEDGFYYDFDVERHFTLEDLEKIEAEMKKIVKDDIKLERFTLTRD
ncbi:MAG: TGS domain-containing protein, partial [Acutalibacteraceae bacterium]